MIIPGYSKYDITEDGVVTRVDSGKVLRPYVNTLFNGKKYLHVSLRPDDSSIATPCNIIRLLALTYLTPPPDNTYVACAIDGDATNTVVSNVVWRDRSSLAKRNHRPNRKKRQSTHCTEETKEMLLTAMKALDEILTMTALANILEVPYSTVRYSMKALISDGKVKKTTRGFGVVK